MVENPPHHNRRSIRLQGYNYSSEGGYFITIVTHKRQRLFGEIVNGEMRLNSFGLVVRGEWLRTAELRPYVELFEDEFIVMPNHIHGIIWITDVVVGAYCNTPLPTNPFHSPGVGIGAIVRGFKSIVTKNLNLLRGTPSTPVWQRNYYEHIISTDSEYDTIAEYIYSNPVFWGEDKENL